METQKPLFYIGSSPSKAKVIGKNAAGVMISLNALAKMENSYKSNSCACCICR